MKRKNFIKSLATFIAAPSLVSMIDEKKVVIPPIVDKNTWSNDDLDEIADAFDAPNLPNDKIRYYTGVTKFRLGDIVMTDLEDRGVVTSINTMGQYSFIEIRPIKQRTFRYKDIDSIHSLNNHS